MSWLFLMFGRGHKQSVRNHLYGVSEAEGDVTDQWEASVEFYIHALGDLATCWSADFCFWNVDQIKDSKVK